MIPRPVAKFRLDKSGGIRIEIAIPEGARVERIE